MEENIFDDREQFLNYVHTWGLPGYEDLEHVLSISEVEEILKDRLTAMAMQIKKYWPVDALFYHDHSNGGVRVNLESREQFGKGREGLLRVIGCGHMLLGIRIIHSQLQNEKFSETTGNFTLLNKWMVEREKWLNGPMEPGTVCKPAVGSSPYMEAFLKNIIEDCITHLPPDQLEIEANRFGTVLCCRYRCLYTEEETEQYPNEYREMLYFHLHEGVVAGVRVKGETLAKQHAFLTRKYNAPVPPVEKGIFSLPMVVAKVPAAADTPTTTGFSSEERQTSSESSSSYSKQQSSSSKQTGSSFSHRAVTRGAGGTRIVHTTGSASSYTMQNWIREESTQSHKTYQWSTYVDVRNTTWTRARGGAAVKVVGEYWKVGCKGCPQTVQVQKRVTPSGRRRTCKWVTIKRVVLVKRPTRRS